MENNITTVFYDDSYPLIFKFSWQSCCSTNNINVTLEEIYRSLVPFLRQVFIKFIICDFPGSAIVKAISGGDKVSGQYRSSTFHRITDHIKCKTYLTIIIEPNAKILHIDSVHFMKISLHTTILMQCELWKTEYVEARVGT